MALVDKLQTAAHDVANNLGFKGPPTGFSKNVNDSLLAASTLVHLKSAGLLGVALTLGGVLVGKTPQGVTAGAFHLAGLLLVACAAACAGAAIFPMKKVRKSGLIFWGDIATHSSDADYIESLGRLDPFHVEREYAATNYHLSRVLDFKYGLIRWTVCLLLVGASFAGAGWLLG